MVFCLHESAFVVMCMHEMELYIRTVNTSRLGRCVDLHTFALKWGGFRHCVMGIFFHF